MQDVHATAIVDPKARLGANVSIGLWSVVGPDVVLEDGVQVGSHVVLSGRTSIGTDNLIMNGCHVGHDCRIGSHNIFAAFTGLAGHVVVEDHAVLAAYTG